MTTIIVPTDFSDYAYYALFYATRVMPKEKCKILLVHSYHKELDHKLSILIPSKNESIVDELRAKVHLQLKAVEHKIMLDSEEINLSVESFYGSHSIIHMINELINNLDVNCLVLGTKGASGLREVFLGSQAVSIVKNVVPIPMFLISENANFSLPKNVAYATDLKTEYDENHFKFIKAIFSNHESLIYLCHVYNPEKSIKSLERRYKSLRNKLKDLAISTYWIAQDKGMEEDISHFCTEHDINLLILTYHKHGFFKSLLKQSSVEKASFHLDIPLLILPDRV